MSLQSTDQIADLITRIRNAIMVNKNEISVPASKLKLAVLEGLKRTNFIADYNVIEAIPRNSIHVVINENNEAPRINEITKVSKPGRRVYAGVNELPKVKSGRGIILISTSKGVMTGDEAKKARLGGEILVKVW
ncbi:MAG: 30S ribosomal protein S8 [Candidatus Nanosyncoccus sp.]